MKNKKPDFYKKFVFISTNIYFENKVSIISVKEQLRFIKYIFVKIKTNFLKKSGFLFFM